MTTTGAGDGTTRSCNPTPHRHPRRLHPQGACGLVVHQIRGGHLTLGAMGFVSER